MKIKLNRQFLLLPLLYLPLVGLFILFQQANIPARNLFVDVFTIGNIPPYTGFFSNLGCFLWCASCTVCFFSYAVLKANQKYRDFFLYSGIINLLFLADDFFVLHDKVLNQYLHIPQTLTLTVYASVLIFYLIKYRRTIKNSDFSFLCLALLFFGISAIFDGIDDTVLKLHYHLNNTYIFLEDGTKIMGVISWCTYLIKVCFKEINLIGR